MNKYYEEKLPFLLRPENVARYEEGSVFILDRRFYPFKKEFVICKDYIEVAKAVTDMVTQSGGSYFAVAQGMVLAAYNVRKDTVDAQLKTLKHAARVLGKARPTNKSIYSASTYMLCKAEDAIKKGANVLPILIAEVNEMFKQRNKRSYALGQNAAALIKDGDEILTHCWAENAIVYTILAALEQGKKIHVFCGETRPYLQGSRLTADAISELEVPTTVISDNMSGSLMQRGMINVFFTGADRVTRSGHVINKVGTFQVALSAHYFEIPFYPLCFGPDKDSYTDEDVIMENRDPNETLFCLGMRTATLNPITGFYPAFDITPPELVQSIVTDKGVFSPYNIEEYLTKTSIIGERAK